jgi:hypothetical protein
MTLSPPSFMHNPCSRDPITTTSASHGGDSQAGSPAPQDEIAGNILELLLLACGENRSSAVELHASLPFPLVTQCWLIEHALTCSLPPGIRFFLSQLLEWQKLLSLSFSPPPNCALWQQPRSLLFFFFHYSLPKLEKDQHDTPLLLSYQNTIILKR